MNIIVLQHIKIEDPGYIKDLMLADGFNLTTIELDESEKIPKKLFVWRKKWKINWDRVKYYSKRCSNKK